MLRISVIRAPFMNLFRVHEARHQWAETSSMTACGRIGESALSAAQGAWGRRWPRRSRRRATCWPAASTRAAIPPRSPASDVLVDFSSPHALEGQSRCGDGGRGVPIVIGTTGLEERHHWLRQRGGTHRRAADRQHLAGRHPARPSGARGGEPAGRGLGHRDRRNPPPHEGRCAIGHRAAAGRGGGQGARHRSCRQASAAATASPARGGRDRLREPARRHVSRAITPCTFLADNERMTLSHLAENRRSLPRARCARRSG
jgi:hypothetical protein